MQFIRNILLVDNNLEFAKNVQEELKKLSHKIKIDRLEDKNLLSQKTSESHISAVYLNGNLGKTDCHFVLRILKMYQKKTNPELQVIFTSDDFDVFQEIITEMEMENIQIIPWPASELDIAKKINDSVFKRNFAKKVVTKNHGELEIDLEFVHVFIESTKQVIKEMGQVSELSHEKPELRSGESEPLEEGVASRIMISSRFFKGNIFVAFPKETFLKLYEAAVFEECEEINDENKDFAAELANIIYGQSKKVFAASGFELDMAIPSLYESTHIDGEVIINIPFNSEAGRFYVAIVPGGV